MRLAMALLFTLGALSPLVTTTVADTTSQGAKSVKCIFEETYQAWRKRVLSPAVQFSSTFAAYTECPEFERMADLGCATLPYLIDKLRDEPQMRWPIHAAIHHIAKNRLPRGEDVVEWWMRGREETPRRFEELFHKWQGLKTGNKRCYGRLIPSGMSQVRSCTPRAAR